MYVCMYCVYQFYDYYDYYDYDNITRTLIISCILFIYVCMYVHMYCEININ